MTETERTIVDEAHKTLNVQKIFAAITAFMLFVLIIITAVLEIQVQTRNDDIDKIRDTTADLVKVVNKSEASSARAEKAINDAIHESRATSGQNADFAKQVQNGLATIQANKLTLQQIEVELKQLEGK